MCHDTTHEQTAAHTSDGAGHADEILEGWSEAQLKALHEALKPAIAAKERLDAAFGCESHVGDWVARVIAGLPFVALLGVLVWFSWKVGPVIAQSIAALLHRTGDSFLVARLRQLIFFCTLSMAGSLIMMHFGLSGQYRHFVFPVMYLWLATLLLWRLSVPVWMRWKRGDRQKTST